MNSPFSKDALFSRYQSPETLAEAEAILTQPEQTEEAFLGARLVMMLNGLT